MTHKEAEEAGALVEALRTSRAALAKLAANEKTDPDELIGVGFSHEHSDSGCMGLGPDVLVPAALAREAMTHLLERIEVRLAELGVTP